MPFYQFQSTHLVWGATKMRIKVTKKEIIFQSTHLVWGATDLSPFFIAIFFYFNPRTSCEVRPGFRWNFYFRTSYFNPRTSCEVRQKLKQLIKIMLEFQSTHLVWGATSTKNKHWARRHRFQSTHLVWGATFVFSSLFFNAKSFQSTHLVWGATAH